MFKEVLYSNQNDIIQILKLFSKDFYLAGGTAIALHLGHRKSLDFDLFSHKEIDSNKIINTLKKNGFNLSRILVDNKKEELTLIINGVKITFLYYPFKIDLSDKFAGIKMPSVELLGAMKFYTLGRRGKWKDYIDLYFILQNGYSFEKISSLADTIFNGAYNEKLLREQLAYYKDIDYSEEVEYTKEKINKASIETFLKKVAIN